jgi:Zn-dependent peptidase ImmA (M78 family)/transcriptional regulator with XRE-family HTH domain
MEIPERLKYARERAGLTGAQVRERTGIGESSLSEFENGKREPSLSQLQSLAQGYGRSIAFFLAEGPIAEEKVLWRQRPPQGTEVIETRFLRLCEQYHNLELWTRAKLPPRLPPVEGNPDAFGYPQAEALAKRVRDELQLGDHPGPVLLRVLEEVAGVKVFHLDFEPTGTAACAMSETFGAAILLNSANARWRRNHDLAHELFHLLTWNVFRSATSSGETLAQPGEKEERLATCFARNVLMPVEAVRSAVNNRKQNDKVPFEALFDVAREFDVSVESLLWHLNFLYRRPEHEEQTKQDIERAKAVAPLLEERKESQPPARPARYHALAVKALRRGEVSIGRFAEYLGISRKDAMKFVEQETTDAESQSGLGIDEFGFYQLPQ